eukprot:CAMPEP_0202498082 /NCGR_PEP_ID=MMETSP1361-20130828/24792_1 /ASSEMBLY_ACC=CAM_ASM_000849 /TAXON_ID=210615 /ORGANISM="Staurosira complex sp., Strain CCMP2646" /LENGTH=106 /DNA_ID=CAMNT_0049129857 /DNA_START=998 /DNA_END=1313 /DNA_ORIENTATION=+
MKVENSRFQYFQGKKRRKEVWTQDRHADEEQRGEAAKEIINNGAKARTLNKKTKSNSVPYIQHQPLHKICCGMEEPNANNDSAAHINEASQEDMQCQHQVTYSAHV